MTRQYAIFDEITIGASLVLTQGDQILDTTGTVDLHRAARSTFAMDLFPGSVEFVVYGTAALATGKVRLGVVTTAADVTKTVGEDAFGWGYDPFDGKIYNNNAVVATIGTAAKGATIAMAVDPVNGSITFTAKNALLGTYGPPAAGSYFFAATTSGAPGANLVYCNAGQNRFDGNDSYGGWWYSPARIDAEYLATEGFTTDPADAIPHLQFMRAINLDNNYTLARGVTFPMFGASAPSQLSGASSATITLNDPYLAFSQLITEDVRDLPAKLRRTHRGSRYDSAESLFTGVIDRVEVRSDHIKAVILKGMSATLQRALQTRLFQPSAQPTIAGKPRPISLGAARNFEPVLVDAATNTYALHDAPLSAIVDVTVAGKSLVYPTDYVLTSDAAGVILTATPQGKFVASTSSVGPAFDPGATDYLGGVGVFTDANADSIPDGWTLTFRKHPTFPALAASYIAGVGVFFPQEYEHLITITETSINIPAGRSFSYKFNVSALGPRCFTGGGPDGTGWPTLCLCGGDYVGSGIAPIKAYQFGWTKDRITHTGDYTGTFTNTTGTDQTFAIAVFLPATVAADPSNPEFGVGLLNIKLNELPEIGVATALAGASLEQMCTELLEVRGGLDPSAWSHADAAAIDAATGYKIGVHYGSDQAPTIDSALKAALANFTAAYYEDGAGVLRFVRWVAPESVASGDRAGSLTPSSMFGDMLVYPDFAENLATRMLGRKNYSPFTDGDFGATSLTNCPLATRAQLKQLFQWSATSGRYLSPRYAAASGNAVETQFDNLADGTAEINRRCAAYQVPRNFFVDTFKAPAGRTFAPGQVWNVSYPLHGLAASKPLLLLAIQESPQDESATLTFWG